MSEEEQSLVKKGPAYGAEDLVRIIRFCFPEQKVSARARLLYEDAPHTCDVVVAALPHEGLACHGQYSGPELMTVLPGKVHAPKENHTTKVAKGDVGFLRFRGGTDFVPEDKVASEIAWFYGDGALPSMADGPVPVNIFARFEPDDWEAFARVCEGLRPGDSCPLRIETVED